MNRSILSPVKYSVKNSPAIVGEVYTNYVRPLISTLKKITSSRDAAQYFKADWESIDHFESFKVIYLNRSHHIIGHATISTGGVCGTTADPKIIFQKALACNATSLMLCHNHPSGNSRPSASDIDLTKKISMASKALHIDLLDHIILTSDSAYYSFSDEGTL